MFTIKSDLIRTLSLAENQFLQVLVDRWDLVSNGNGISLKVRFNENTPAINTRQAKYLLLAAMGDYYREKQGSHQAAIDSFFADPRGGVFAYNDERFPFRYVSGGTLPIVSIDNRSYYCLFYRDIFPIGWNIANGGCDTRGELHNPFRIIERELCEELFVVNPIYKVRYIFERNKNKLADGLEFEVAENLWESEGNKIDIRNFSELMLPIKWIEGPDSVHVRYEDSEELVTGGYFLNINAKDFGIEVDKIGHISLDPFDVLLSGEIIQGHQVNTPIGLFGVERFSGTAPDPAAELLPDKFFFNGIAHDGDSFRDIYEREFIPYISKYRTSEEHAYWHKTPERFSLCPVTYQILKRYLQFKKNGETSGNPAYDMILSFGEEDRALASEVHDYFTKKKKRVFMRTLTTTHEDWANIDRALGSSTCLIAVGSSRKALTHHFPSYEYRSFHRDMMYGKKGKRARLVTFVSGMKQQDLPPPLCHYKGVTSGPRGINSALKELASLMK